MKNYIMLVPIIVMILSSALYASTPIEKIVPVDHIYIPTGFDSDDNVEVVITGFLPNLCHKSPAAKVSIDGQKVYIKMTSLNYRSLNRYCPEMVVPFTKTVSLGILERGKYEIRVNGQSPWELNDFIKVLESTSDVVDKFNYAYVQYIDKEVDENHVVLKGYNPSDCFVLDKIAYISNNKDTYSVIPMLKQISDFCPFKMVPFSYEWEVPRDFDAEKLLIHVRTMDGNSVNTIFNRRK